MNNRMIYQKEETREKIIGGATQLFTQRGLFDVQMKDIAEYVGVSRHTLYRYFRDKADLAISIVNIFLKSVFVDAAKAHYQTIEKSGLSGWEKLRHCFFSLWVTNRMENEFRFLAEFDAYYSGTRLSKEMVDKLNNNIDPFTTDLWYRLIIEGIEDGSIKAGQDPRLLLVTLLNSTRGLNQRIILRGEGLVETGNCELLQMMENFLNLLFDGIKKN